jgi:hypothetical protein
MNADTLKEFANLVAVISAVITGILGIFKYFQYRTRRDKLMLVRQSFEAVAKSLASNVEVERLAGAILLRRFFDRETEVGIAGTPHPTLLRRFFHSEPKDGTADEPPYSKEAVDVTAAILRSQTTGNFQKLLADGLAFAPSLERADLQRTNLQFAYLGSRKRAGKPSDEVKTNLSHADFYRADLSNASLKRAKAQEAVFYQARMHNTILTGADLSHANFFEADLNRTQFIGADLNGAKFDGARIERANFKGAQNIPPIIASKLDESGVYQGKEPLNPPQHTSEARQIPVFISKPGFLDYQQQQQVSSLQARLEAEGMNPQTLERPYPHFGAIGEIHRLMSNCAGAVIFGFKQLEVREGLWRSSTPEEKQVKDQYLPTPWNQFEAGMAAMRTLPMFVICERGVDGGIFDIASGEHQIYRVFTDEDWNATTYLNSFRDWCWAVRERSRSSLPIVVKS